MAKKSRRGRKKKNIDPGTSLHLSLVPTRSMNVFAGAIRACSAAKRRAISWARHGLLGNRGRGKGGGGLLGSTGAPPGQPPDPHLSNTRSRPPYGPLGPRIPFWQMSAHTCRGVTAARFCVSSGALRAFRARYAPLQRGKNSRAAARSRQKAPKTAPKCAVLCRPARRGGGGSRAPEKFQYARTRKNKKLRKNRGAAGKK